LPFSDALSVTGTLTIFSIKNKSWCFFLIESMSKGRQEFSLIPQSIAKPIPSDLKPANDIWTENFKSRDHCGKFP
jgi:hypothetical protein